MTKGAFFRDDALGVIRSIAPWRYRGTMAENQGTSRFCFSRAGGRISSRPGKRVRGGFTLTELMVTTVIVAIVILALGSVVADGVRGWQRMYDRVYADVVTDGFVARRVFDRIIRKASRQMYSVDDSGEWLKVYYYSSGAATTLDRYGLFYVSGDELKVEHGIRATPETPLQTETVCGNVSSCVFKGDGRSAQMILTLDDGSQSVTVVSSAVMHNGS